MVMLYHLLIMFNGGLNNWSVWTTCDSWINCKV